MAENASKPWLEVSSAIDAVRNSLSAALREQNDFEKGTGELAKATATFKQVAMGLGIQLAKTNSVSRETARNFYEAARGVREAAKAAREMELRYKGMQLAAMSVGDIFMATTDKVVQFGNSIQKLAGIGVAGGVGLKALTDANLSFKRALFESDKIASRYGESLGSMKKAFATIRSATEMSQQDFANLNKSIKELYLGIPPTTQAIAKMVQELRGRVGYSDDVITKTLEGLVGLQSKVPQIMESVTAAWEAAAKGQGDAANKMALQMRLLLSQSGATRGEIEKVMAAMEPRSAGDRSPFLNFEQGMAKAEQRAKDAQIALAIKLEPTLRLINNLLTKMADILSGVDGGFANAAAKVAAFALPFAGAVTGIKNLSNAYKVLKTAMAIRGAGVGASLLGVGAGGTVAAGGGAAAMKAASMMRMGRFAGGAAPLITAGFAGYDEYRSRVAAGQSGSQAALHGGGRMAASMAGGWLGMKTGALVGSAFGPAGTVIGGAIGGIGGSLVGSSLYRKAAGSIGPGGAGGAGEPKDEQSIQRIEIFTRARKEQAELFASQAGLFSDNYAGGAKEVRKLLQTEEGINKVRDLAIAKQIEGKSLAERIVFAENELRKGTIARSEAITLIAGKEKDVATATKEVERISKSLVDIDRQRYEHSSQIQAAMDKQLQIYNKLSEVGSRTVDGLAQSIARLQGEGLFRDGFGDTFENAVKSQEAVVEASSKKMQAVLFRNLAGRGEIKDLDVFINLKDDKVKGQVEAARKGIKESLSKEDSLLVQIQKKEEELPRAKGNEEATGALLAEIEALRAELDAAKEASKGFNDTLMGLATVLPDADNLRDKLTELHKQQASFIASGGDIKSIEYNALVNQIDEISAAYNEATLAAQKLNTVKSQEAESKEKAMLANNERAIQLSKQRISLAESMNMGMARTWKYTKETVALQERELQLLTQQSERFGQLMQQAAGQAGLKLDLNFADADLEAFLADVQKRLIEQRVPLEKQKDIMSAITTQANKRLDVEGKILQTSGEIMETTKQMREGWLEAVQGSMMGFGDMEKIIGTQDKSVTQLLAHGAPATYKYGGFMDHRPTELARPPEYSDIYGAFRNTNPNANPFPETALEKYTGVRNFPYNKYGDINDIKRQAQVASQQGGMLMTMGTPEQDLGMQGVQQASINAATSLTGVNEASQLLIDAFREMAGLINQAHTGPTAARVPGGMVSVPWVQGVQPSNNWGAQGAGTAQGVSQGSSYLPLGPRMQTEIPSMGVPIGTHARGGSIKGYGYGGTLAAGSYIVSEGPTRANAAALSQIPGVTFAARGGGVGETRAGHDSIYYDVAGYGTGGAVLMPNEAIIPPAFAHLGPSLNHYARGGLEIHTPQVGDVFAGNTPAGWEGAGGRAWKINGGPRLTGNATPPWMQNPNSQWSQQLVRPNPSGPNPNMRLATRGAGIGLDGKPIDTQSWGRQIETKPVNSISPTMRTGASVVNRLTTAHRGGMSAVRSPLGRTMTAAGMGIEGIDRLAAGENWGGAIGGAAGAGVFIAGLGYVSGAIAAGLGVAGLAPAIAIALGLTGANYAVKGITGWLGVNNGEGFDAFGSAYNALTGTGASYGRDTFSLKASAGTASKASYASGFIHSLPGELWESTKDLVNPFRMVDISDAYDKTWKKDAEAIKAQSQAQIPINSQIPLVLGFDQTKFLLDGIEDMEWVTRFQGGIRERNSPQYKMHEAQKAAVKAKNEKRAKELRDYKTEMAILVTDGKRYKYQQELKKYKESNPERWANLVKKHHGSEALTEAEYAQRKINEVKKKALEKGEKSAIQSAREKLSLGVFTGPFASKDSFGEGRLLKVPDPPDWMRSAQDQTHLTSLYAENRPAPIDTDLETHPIARMFLKQKEGRETLRMAKDGQRITPAEYQMPSAARINAFGDKRNLTSIQLNELRLKAYQATQPTISGIETRYVGSYGKSVQSGIVPMVPDRMAAIGSMSNSTLPIVPVTRTIEVSKPPPKASTNTQPVTKAPPEQKMARGGFVGGYRPPKRFALGGWAGSVKPNSGRGSMGRRSSERMNAFMDANGIQGPRSVPFRSQMNDGPMGGGNFNRWSGSVKPASMRGSFGKLSGSMEDRSAARMNYQLNQTARAGYRVGTQAISTAPQKNTPAGFDGAARVVTVKVEASNAIKDLATFQDANAMKENRLAMT